METLELERKAARDWEKIGEKERGNAKSLLERSRITLNILKRLLFALRANGPLIVCNIDRELLKHFCSVS